VPAAPKQSPQVLAQAAAPRSGGYFVQLSSQRSEAEAQTALRGMQSRFSSVLGGQPSTVRRAELGERGVFYRAMVGPFASRDQATQLCSSLKAAGADCIVQSN
jgi:cell division septation protein DedD